MLEKSLWIFILSMINIGLLSSIFMIIKGTVIRLKIEYFFPFIFGNLFFALVLLGIDWFISVGIIIYFL